VTSELPEEVTSELPKEMTPESPEEVTSQLPEEETSELPEEVTSELPAEVRSELDCWRMGRSKDMGSTSSGLVAALKDGTVSFFATVTATRAESAIH
jgi:hypothetical protein